MLFRRNRKLIALFIFLIFASACSEKIWQKDSGLFLQELHRADYTWLLSLNFSKHNPSDVYDFGPGAALMLGRIFESQNQLDQARLFYALEWSRTAKIDDEDRFWAEKAGKSLYPLYLGMEQKLAAESFLVDYLFTFPDDKDAALSLAILYLEQNKGKEGSKILLGISESQVSSRTAEYRYAKFLIYYLEKNPAWKTEMDNLLLNTRTAAFFKDFAQKLDAFPELTASEEYKYASFKSLIFAGKYADAYLVYKTFDWNKTPITAELVRDLSMMYRYAAKISEGIDALTRFSFTAKDEALKFRLMQRIGWLYYAGASYSAAASWFLSAYETDPLGADADWALWYYWQSLYQEKSETFHARAFTKSFSVNDKSYFSDLWDSVIIGFTTKKNFSGLLDFYLKAKNYMNDSDLIRVIHILEVAQDQGLFDAAFDSKKESSTVDLANVPWYHEILASQFSGEKAILYSSEGKASKAKKKVSLQEKYIEACLFFGLYKDASNAQNALETQDPDFTRYIIGELLKEKQYYQSIMLSGPLGLGKIDSLSKMDLKVLYPLAYKDLIEKEAKNQGLPPWFLMALVRQESAFGSDAASGAGATGLAQIMPETAVELATELKMQTYDLNKPEDSLKLGAYYIRRMMQKNDYPYLGLMAYNAGPTRLKTWMADFEGLPALLRIETVPFLETRSYVKRIYVGSLIYGMIWYGKSEEEIRTWFFSVFEKE